jgi:hypothetical protein
LPGVRRIAVTSRDRFREVHPFTNLRLRLSAKS